MDTTTLTSPQTVTSDENDAAAVESARPVWQIALVVGLVALLLGALLGYAARGSGAPAADSADVGFARDMSIHHEQAVQMATLIMDRTEDEAIRSLAFDILTTQQGQIGIMSGWLDAWGQAWTSAGPRMAWMGMPTQGLMPGMATAEQMSALRNAEGTAADILFLQLMIPHHLGGVEMAEAAADMASRDQVRRLAQSMVEAQSLEVDYMQSLLQQKSGETLPVPADSSGHDAHEPNTP